MNYEEQSFETILERCLKRAPGNLDKREGSVLYDALAPACAELAVLYTEMSTLLDRAFPDTATGEDLDRKCKERGLFRRGATAALRRGTLLGTEVPLGSRFSGGGTIFTVTQREPEGYRLAAETVGTVGNRYFGTLLPLEHLPDLTAAELGEVLVPGEDIEEDESLRKRYFASFDNQAFGGNVADYRGRVGALEGVGGVKVARAPEGGGTVGVTIQGSDWGVPSETLVEAVQAAVDPVVSGGEGLGLAPIGHRVQVAAVTGRQIDVDLVLTLEEYVSWENLREAVEAALGGYLLELAALWEESEGLTVRVSQMETRVLGVAGVLDVGGTKINGAAGNLALPGTEIPVLGVVRNGAV